MPTPSGRGSAWENLFSGEIPVAHRKNEAANQELGAYNRAFTDYRFTEGQFLPHAASKGVLMGGVWLRTISHSMVRADRVTEIASSRGSVHEETGYSLKVVVDGKAHILVDNSSLPGTIEERLAHAQQMQDALLAAIDAANSEGTSVVISHEPDSERWMLVATADLAGEPAT
jgi:hypothetical protein